MITASFKTNDAIFEDLRSLRAFLPLGDLSLNNYVSVFTRSSFVQSIATSGLKG